MASKNAVVSHLKVTRTLSMTACEFRISVQLYNTIYLSQLRTLLLSNITPAKLNPHEGRKAAFPIGLRASHSSVPPQ